ncbi:MAG: amidohydrolase [Proteobacteria bacterium]|nr:amidohydrolase [Pseudomonadota bacterium]
MMRNNTRVRLLISTLLTAALLLAACGQAPQEDPAEFVLLNGGIYTVDAERSWAEAAAIRDGEIIAVGTNASIQPLIGDATEVFDLQGRMAMPGIHDSHVHPLEGGYEQVHCNVWDADNVDLLIGALMACDRNHEGEWFNAVGLDLGIFGLTGPDKSLLDGIATGKYIFVDAADGHAALVNDKVLDLIGYDANTPDPAGGVIERREGSREPNGTIRETARDSVDKLRPPRSLDVSIAAMRGAVKLMNSYGITSVYDVWIGEHEMQVYQALDNAGELTVRVLGGIIDEGVFEKHTGDDLERVLRDRGNYESRYISYNSVKFMVDGVFEGETGAVLQPYNSVDHHGVLNYTPAELRERVARFYDSGMQLHFHTIGDRAVREALDALEYARDRGSEEHRKLRHTLSHLALISPEDMPRFAELNTGASFTMVWGYTSEWTMNLEIPAIGRDRVTRRYPIRSVHEAGGVVLGGSDWNYGDLDPLLSIETGITRDDPFGPSSPADFEVFGDEMVDLATMIDAYTINGAWQTHSEHVSGSIEPGKRADLVVFDRNLFSIDASEISEAVVDLTIFDGRIVYRRHSGP